MDIKSKNNIKSTSSNDETTQRIIITPDDSEPVEPLPETTRPRKDGPGGE
ncbi:MAG: hypothetical protein GX567_11330 [Clostridia bacterium]|nr:hypothetical protein [Clostridia bacterium]